ncbi:hypothetical protein EDD27_8688 [Nonomuraea polychroma]|uniref:Uncharacterized protein n=1 Tax=Nonomuraea polychroma TaxID=46176 RepID=A0A438MJP3_9ACTN|nr:hypothetical protein EDD27_8688 [Nonomuraea polychroma]
MSPLSRAPSGQRPAASGERDWVRDAAEAAKYYDRISKGWDRYGGIAVPPPLKLSRAYSCVSGGPV